MAIHRVLQSFAPTRYRAVVLTSCHCKARWFLCLSVFLLVVTATACQRQSEQHAARNTAAVINEVSTPSPICKSLAPDVSPELKTFIDAAAAQVGVTTGYDPSYVSLSYPGGDVPKETGVCSDVLVRAFRGVGVDLQKEIHEDMRRAFADYPRKWGLSRPDSNIDHRRVPNLMTYFSRKGKSISVTNNADDYRLGDIVTWDLGGGVDHIGIVTDRVVVSQWTRV